MERRNYREGTIYVVAVEGGRLSKSAVCRIIVVRGGAVAGYFS
jgi:hypothetical protein